MSSARVVFASICMFDRFLGRYSSDRHREIDEGSESKVDTSTARADWVEAKQFTAYSGVSRN